jgi:hypothetical protein
LELPGILTNGTCFALCSLSNYQIGAALLSEIAAALARNAAAEEDEGEDEDESEDEDEGEGENEDEDEDEDGGDDTDEEDSPPWVAAAAPLAVAPPSVPLGVALGVLEQVAELRLTRQAGAASADGEWALQLSALRALDSSRGVGKVMDRHAEVSAAAQAGVALKLELDEVQARVKAAASFDGSAELAALSAERDSCRGRLLASLRSACALRAGAWAAEARARVARWASAVPAGAVAVGDAGGASYEGACAALDAALCEVAAWERRHDPTVSCCSFGLAWCGSLTPFVSCRRGPTRVSGAVSRCGRQ